MHTICLLAITLLVAPSAAVEEAPGRPGAGSARDVRHVGGTSVVGDTDTRLWQSVLDVLPVRPRVVIVIDVDTLPAAARARLHGLEAFVLTGHPAVFVVRQAATLRQAALGDPFDRLVLASVLWHEMAHGRGLDERSALTAEQGLWRELVAAGRTEASLGLAYVQRLEDEKRRAAAQPAGSNLATERTKTGSPAGSSSRPATDHVRAAETRALAHVLDLDLWAASSSSPSARIDAVSARPGRCGWRP